MLHLKPVSAEVIKELEILGCLEFLAELTSEDRELFLLKSILASVEGDTLVGAAVIPPEAVPLLEQISGGVSPCAPR